MIWTMGTLSTPHLARMFAPAPSPSPTTYSMLRLSSTLTSASPSSCMLGYLDQSEGSIVVT